MPESDPEAHGPIDFVLIEFPGPALGGGTAVALVDLVERGVIRLYDLLVVRKEEDGTFSGVNIEDMTSGEAGELAVFSGARSGLLGDDDVAEAAGAMAPGTIAVLIVFENAWDAPFAAAAVADGGQLIASERIPAQAVMDALDVLDAADATT